MMNDNLQEIMESSDKRTLNVYFLLDTSGSTKDNGIINILNREMNSIDSKFSKIIEELKFGATDIRFRVLKFGGFSYDKLSWIVGSRIEYSSRIGIDTLVGEGNTWLSEAIDEFVDSIETIDRGDQPYPTLVFLVNDGDYSGEDDFLNKAIKRFQQIKDRFAVILAICNFENDIEYIMQPIISRDRFNNLLKLDSFSSENFKHVLSQLKLSMMSPASSIVDDELV
jgi:uncharacterized protein YegL